MQAAGSSITLIDQKPRWNSLYFAAAVPVIDTNAHPWAVLLNENVYVKDTGDVLAGQRIWKYSITKNIWSMQSRPDLNGYKNYVLTTYRSQLACIGGYVQIAENEYTESKRIFTWNENDREWKDDIVIQIEGGNVPWHDVSASSVGSDLFLAWQKDNKVNIYYYDGQQREWIRKEGPESKASGSSIEISIINGTIFLTEHNDFTATVISKASVESICSGVPDPSHFGAIMWKEINWSRRDMRLHLPSYISNLTFLGQDIVLLDPQHPQPAMLFRLPCDCESDQALAWTEVENRLIFDWRSNTYPSIFCLSDGALLVLGLLDGVHGHISVLKR